MYLFSFSKQFIYVKKKMNLSANDVCLKIVI
jgi:hypothetical protein